MGCKKNKDNNYIGDTYMIGKKFNDWTVLKYSYKKKSKKYYLCQCKCGRKHVIVGSILKCEGIKKCKMCCRNKLEGLKFGRLTVLSMLKKTKKRKTYARCRCDCGKICVVQSNRLVAGQTKSCGCLKIELATKLVRKHNPYPRIYKNEREAGRVRSARKRSQLKNSYIKSLLVNATGIKTKNITPEIIEAKRNQIKLKREIERMSE